MKKNVYIVLLVLTLASIGYLGYYTITKPIVIETTTPEISRSTSTLEIEPTVRTFSLQSGKKILVSETNPISQELSTITITTEGFASNSPIILEKNKVTDFFLADLNQDSSEEFIIITTSGGSGSYGDVTIFTTAQEQNLVPVTMPSISEEDTKQGALFEGYMGHDIFSLSNNTLLREFPLYAATNTNSTPTNGMKKVFYSLIEKEGTYSVQLSNMSASTTLPQATSTKGSTPETSLNATSWVWISSTEKDVTTPAKNGDKFILTFDKDMKVHSTTDCNTLSGSATTTTNTLQFSPLAMTKMFCESSQDTLYAGLLSKTKSFSVTGSKLTLTLSDKGILTFTKK